jgi:hypothetical protein
VTRHFSLSDVCTMSRLTERTLRKYLADGTLIGEKADGRWRFSASQVMDFFLRPGIARLMEARRRAVADDFLNARIKPRPACLCVLDLPDAPDALLARVLDACVGLEMAYARDASTRMTRVTLAGDPAAVRAALEALKP